MGQPAYAGVAVGVIFIAIIGSIVGYKLFKKWQYRKQRKSQEAAAIKAQQEGGLTTTAADFTHGQVLFPMRSASPGPSMVGSLYGEAYHQDSWRGSMSKASFLSTPAGYMGSSASEYGLHRPRRSSSQGLMSTPPLGHLGGDGSNDPSMPGSPISQGEGILSSQSEAFDGIRPHSRALSSASSTMTLKRSYAGSAYRGMSGSQSPAPYGGRTSTSRRDSYLPHLPENREKVQIVPPQPLGFSFGMATAVDQKTLAFAQSSGIGDFDEEFSKGLLWAAQSGKEPADEMEAEAMEAATRAHIARGGNIGEQERMRYLAEGPSRTLNPAIRGAIHNHLYSTPSQPNSSGARTPEGPNSRPRSPAPANWDGSGSSSDIGPSVSQRGGTMPSHPLENSEQTSQFGNRNPAAAMVNEQSPLGLMQFQAGGMEDEQADISLTSMGGSSPILKAFQNPSRQTAHSSPTSAAQSANRAFHTPNDSMNSTHGGIFTPGMTSSDSRSQTSSRTGPPSLSHNPPQFNSPSSDQYRNGEERRIDIGNVNQLPELNFGSNKAKDEKEENVTTSLAKEKKTNRSSSRWSGPWNRTQQSTSAA